MKAKARCAVLSPKHYGKRSIDGNIADSLSALKDIENFIKNKPA